MTDVITIGKFNRKKRKLAGQKVVIYLLRKTTLNTKERLPITVHNFYLDERISFGISEFEGILVKSKLSWNCCFGWGKTKTCITFIHSFDLFTSSSYIKDWIETFSLELLLTCIDTTLIATFLCFYKIKLN